MQNRIDRLEGLVLSLMTNGSSNAGPAAALAAISGDSSAGSTGLSNEVELDDDNNNAEESDTEQVTKSFGVMKMMDNNKSYYISEAHWATVLNDVSNIFGLLAKHLNSQNLTWSRSPRYEISSHRINSNLRSRHKRSSLFRRTQTISRSQHFYSE